MKSFSELTKEELYKSINANTCCDRGEFVGMMLLGCAISRKEIKLVTENRNVLDRFIELGLRLGYRAEECVAENSSRYSARITDKAQIMMLLQEYSLTDGATGVIRYRIPEDVTANPCCRQAFVKGAFLGGGTVIDPEKNYNLEIITPYMGLNQDLSRLLANEGFGFKSVIRKSKYVLYIKNSELIQDFLSYIGAYKAQMQLINVKIEKEIRNDFVRSINSETANLEKTINASVRQIQAIETIEEKMGIEELPEDLRTIARLRLEYKSTSLQELGRLCEPPLGKSGVNHRLQRIIALADRLSEE